MPKVIGKVISKKSTEKPFFIVIGDGTVPELSKDFDSRLKTMSHILVDCFDPTKRGSRSNPMSLATAGVDRVVYMDEHEAINARD